MDKNLLQRYVEGNVSAEETETVVDWLDADQAHVREYMALHKLYDVSVWNRPAMRQPRARARYAPFLRKLAIEGGKAAAIFLLACIAMQYVHRRQTKPAKKEAATVWQSLHVPAGQRAELRLADGSHIWLNARSRLFYPSRFEEGKREVRLEGEAYFTVRSDRRQPFIVKTSQMDVKALGTEFNLLSFPGDSLFEIALLKGEVELLPGQQPAYRMKVNETVAWKDGRFQTDSIRDFDYFRWQEGLICLHSETVGDILAKLERYFDVRIVVKRKSIVNYRYSGKFRTSDGVEQVLRVLQLEHKFSYKRDHEKNIITIQ
jgi:ferric-dicitrate binding protein FerR (iron transport regulator)